MSGFQRLFGYQPSVIIDAPGRVNLIGEHTDYNGGFVLPTSIPQRTVVELAPRTDRIVRASSANTIEAERLLEYTLGGETPGQDWLDYIQGLTWVLRAEGYDVPGFDLRVESSVPLGSGLASSAALEISCLRALRRAFDLPLDDVRIALIGQKAENTFVGAQVGIMDQMACSLASDRTALFIDTRSLAYERVPLPTDMDLVVINSGVSHSHAAGDYNTRRAECERACALLGVRQLRDLSATDLPRLSALPETLLRRARHVITENERVLTAVGTMRVGDLVRLGELFYASHDSMRKDYEVSIPETDLLVELARGDRDVYGARLTGGGFGGSVVMIVRKGTNVTVSERITCAYENGSGRHATILVPAGTSS